MVEAVDVFLGRFEDRAEQAPRHDFDRVTVGRRESMLPGLGPPCGQVGIQHPAACARHQLHAVADSQNGQVAVGGGREERLVKGKLVRGDEIELNARREWAVAREIVTARNQQAIEAACQRVGIRLDREMDRKPSSAVDSIGVATIDVVVVTAGTPTSTVVEAEGDPDSRSVHGASIAICGMLPGWHRW